ncbi:hypothetical protein [Nocardia flavorosea]|uniref:hypothetical protein n=2 Tax=Nocardia flavorosea TaxID=53429 RepID=UPI000AE0E653|nr:hypothetical protein [Nocardia flavorosea]
MVQEPGTWAGLKHDASQNMLYFDPAAAVTGADAAGRMIEQMMAMKAAISDYGMDSVIDFTGGVLGSSRELAEIYIQRAERLKVVLQDHINIGTEMANAFIQAGLYYKRVEEENSDALDKLNDYKVPAESSAEVALTHSRFGDLDLPDGEKRDAGNVGTEDDFRYTDAYDVPDELHDYVGRQESISPDAVGLENSASLGMREFRGLADKTGWGIFGLAGYSQGWWRLAANTRTELQKFEESIESIQNKWRGDAANKARTATKNYTDASAPLWKSMFSMSENLHYSAEWLRRTQMSMPQQDFEFTSASIKQAVLQRYREEWEKHYAEGMKNSLREMPVIEGPIAEPKPPPDNNGDSNNNNNENNGGGGNNNGGGENGGERTPEEAYDEGYDDGYEKGFEEGSQQGGGQGEGQGQGQGEGQGQGQGQGGSRGEGGGQGRGEGSSQGQGSQGQGEGSGRGQGGGQGGGQDQGGGQEVPEVPSYDEAEYGSGNQPGGDTRQDPPADQPAGDTEGTPVPTPVTGTIMPKNPTAADILSKLTGIPKSHLPDALKNMPITGQDGKAPTLADALSKITGIPVDEMPQELQDTSLEQLYSADSPYGVDSTLFGGTAENSGVESVEPLTTGEPRPTESDQLSALLAGEPGAIPSGVTSAQSQNVLDRLVNMLTQGIQAFTLNGADTMPGMDQLARMLDPAQLQGHLTGMLDPEAAVPAMGGSPGGAGLPVGDSSSPLAPYPGSQPSGTAFPRASLPTPRLELAGYSAAHGTSTPGGTPGMPVMGSPAAGAGAATTTGQSGNHTPGEFLTSRENVDEVFDETPSKVRPVIEQ